VVSSSIGITGSCSLDAFASSPVRSIAIGRSFNTIKRAIFPTCSCDTGTLKNDMVGFAIRGGGVGFGR